MDTWWCASPACVPRLTFSVRPLPRACRAHDSQCLTVLARRRNSSECGHSIWALLPSPERRHVARVGILSVPPDESTQVPTSTYGIYFCRDHFRDNSRFPSNYFWQSRINTILSKPKVWCISGYTFRTSRRKHTSTAPFARTSLCD